MSKVIIALAYMLVIILIGILSAKKVKTADDFATANKKIPFWTNVYSMASAQIGAGATMGVASITYAYGISGMSLGIGAALGAILCGLIFAEKIREANVTTIPELIRNKLGVPVANVMSALIIFAIFGVLAAQIRSLGTILQIFIPSLSLAMACIIMSGIMLLYVVIGGMVATYRTDKLNISIMVISVMIIIPMIALFRVGGMSGIALKIDPKYFNPTGMGLTSMISMFLYFGLSGMVNSENFLRICGAKNAKEAKRATLTSALMIYLPYMIFCSIIGLAGIALIPKLGTSDSIFPAMINSMSSGLLGAFLLSALLAAVMGTAASVAMVTGVTFTRDVVQRVFPQMTNNKVLLAQRLSIIGFTIIGIVVAIYGRSIVGIMEDVGAVNGAAVVPLFIGLFFWKKINPKGAMITIAVAVVSTLAWWFFKGPYISHFLFGLVCSTITMIIACNLTYKDTKGVLNNVGVH